MWMMSAVDCRRPLLDNTWYCGTCSSFIKHYWHISTRTHGNKPETNINNLMILVKCSSGIIIYAGVLILVIIRNELLIGYLLVCYVCICWFTLWGFASSRSLPRVLWSPSVSTRVLSWWFLLLCYSGFSLWLVFWICLPYLDCVLSGLAAYLGGLLSLTSSLPLPVRSGVCLYCATCLFFPLLQPCK